MIVFYLKKQKCLFELSAFGKQKFPVSNSYFEVKSTFLYFYFINFASQAGRAPQQLAPITVAPFFTLPTMIHNRRQTTTPGTTCPTLSDKCVGSFMSDRIINIEGL